MSKSVLVLDTPENCLDCQFCYELDEGVEACCSISDDDEDTSLMKKIDCEYINIATQSVHITALDVHFMNIARSVSWGVREIRARRSGNYKATDKIRESVFTGSPFYVYIFQFSLHFLNDSPYTAAALLEDMP